MTVSLGDIGVRGLRLAIPASYLISHLLLSTYFFQFSNDTTAGTRHARYTIAVPPVSPCCMKRALNTGCCCNPTVRNAGAQSVIPAPQAPTHDMKDPQF